MTIKSYYNSTTGDNIITLGTSTDGPEFEGDLAGRCTFRQKDNIVSNDAFTFEVDGVALTAGAATQAFVKIEPTINQSATAGYTAIEVDVTETAIGSGSNLLLDLQVASASKFSVTRTGVVSMATGLSLLDDVYIAFGNSPNAYIEYDTNQTNDAFQIALDSTNNTLMICNVANKAGNFAFPNWADPTIVICSSEVAGTATDEWMAFQHNGNNGVFFCGKGGVQFQQQADVDSAASTSVFSFDTLGAAEITGASGTAAFLRIVPEIDQSGTAGYTGLLLDVTETATGSGNKRLLDLQTGSTSRFNVNSAGLVTVGTGTTGHSLSGSGDLLVSDALEVDGVASFDDRVDIYDYIRCYDGKYIAFGGSDDSTIQYTGSHLNWGLAASVNVLHICEEADKGTAWTVATDTNPTLCIHAAGTPDTNYLCVNHNQTDMYHEIGVGSSVTNHSTPVSLSDDASFDLPTSSAGYGFFMVDDGEEYMQIVWKVDGTVQLVAHSTNVDNADTDGYFCAFDNGSAVRIRNRLGSAKTVTFDYHYTTSP